MKRALCLFVLLMLLGAASPMWAAEPVGKADVVTGTVTVEREGKSEAVKMGDPLFLHDKLHTQTAGLVEIVFPDGSRVKLASETVLEITEYLYDPSEKKREGLLSMVSGKARFVVQDLQDFKDKRFRVQSQTAIVGTRDTDFIVKVTAEAGSDELYRIPEIDDVCKGPSTVAFCVQNAIMMSSPGGGSGDMAVVLTPNMFSRTCGKTPPTQPVFVTLDQRR